MDPGPAELDMLEALLAQMQNGNHNQYEEVDDDDDDDYEDDDDEDDDDEDGYFGDHAAINTILNPYGGAGGGDGGDLGGGQGGGNMQAISMNFLQSLLNMNSSMPGMGDVEAAIGSPMGGMSVPLDGGSGGFLPSMQNILPNMNSEMAGALAGAFAGSMGAFMNYGSGSNSQDYDDEDDDDALSDDEEEDDDEDDEDDLDDDKHTNIGTGAAIASAAAIGGGLLTAGLLSAANASNNHNFRDPYPGHPLPPPIAAATSLPALPAPTHAPAPSSGVVPLGFVAPNPLAPKSANIAPFIPITSTVTPIAATSLANISGGTMSKADPLAALVAGVGSVCLGANVLAPIVTNSLGNGGGTTVVNKLNISDVSTVIGSPNESFNNSNNRTLIEEVTSPAVMASIAATMQNPSKVPQDSHNKSILPTNVSVKMPPTSIATTQIKAPKDDSDDDKASLGSDSTSESVRSGGGKSDTESVGKKTPSPVPEGTHVRGPEAGSCSSITDLASATESMRDSDTDNHSEAHNVTSNLSDLDSDIQEQHRRMLTSAQYPPMGVGALPMLVERPSYGWGSMHGLDTAKEALKNLFYARSFPEVFEGTEGICKGILLFGPPGSGKTSLAKALAKEANNSLFVGVNTSFLIQHHPLEVTSVIRYMFDEARRNKPTVILFDQIEYLSYDYSDAPLRAESAMRAKDEIMHQVRGQTCTRPGYQVKQPNDGVLVLGTTNEPWVLEDRMRRLFAYNIHVKLPGEKARHELLRTLLHAIPHRITDEEFNCLVSKSDKFSAGDLNVVITQACQDSVVPYVDSSNASNYLKYDNLATCMTHYKCRFNDTLKAKYTAYIQSATHRTDELQDSSKEKKDKPKGVKRISQRIAKAMASVVLAVID